MRSVKKLVGRWLPALAAAAAAGTSGGGTASAGAISESFDGYGGERRALFGLGAAGGGWQGEWFHSERPDYLPGERLTYDMTGYDNSRNGSGPDHGVATSLLESTGYLSTQIARRRLEEPMTETIWISFLVQPNGSIGSTHPDALLWLGAGIGNFIRFFNTNVSIRLGGDTVNSPEGGFSHGETYLMLALLQVEPGNEDMLDLWVNPDLSGGPAGLGKPLLSLTKMAFDSLEEIGLALSADVYLDAIRISDAPDAFEHVTSAALPLAGTFAVWREKHFTSQEIAESLAESTADPDGDGIGNLLEYALGLDPRSPGIDALPEQRIQEIDGFDFLTLVFRRPAESADIHYAVDASSDLQSWADSAIFVNSADNQDGTETVTYRDSQPLSAFTRRFLQLRVTLNE